MQKVECAIGWLRNPMQVQQTKPTMEGLGWKIVLFENVRERPEAIALNQTLSFHYCCYSERCGIWLIVEWVFRIGGRIPFCVIDRSAASPAACALRYFSHNSPLAPGEFYLSLIVLCAEIIGRIVMCGNKICGYLVSLAKND